MTLTPNHLWQTARLTLADPRAAARRVIAWPLTRGERWTVLAFTATASTLAAEVFVMLSPPVTDPAMATILASPLLFAAMQFAGIALMAVLMRTVGGRFGGVGTFDGALAVVGWMQVILLALQVVQVLALALLPPLVGIIALVSLGVTLWVMPNMIAELHGFRSAFLTLLGMVGTLFALVLSLSVLLLLVFGVEGLGNV